MYSEQHLGPEDAHGLTGLQEIPFLRIQLLDLNGKNIQKRVATEDNMNQILNLRQIQTMRTMLKACIPKENFLVCPQEVPWRLRMLKKREFYKTYLSYYFI